MQIDDYSDTIWNQTIGRIFNGLVEICVGIVCTVLAIIIIPIFLVLKVIYILSKI